MDKLTDLSDKKKIQCALDWNKVYIKAIMQNLNPSGDVLVIGFGNGEASDYIQSLAIKSQTIIENNPHSLKILKNWKDKHPHVKIIEGQWNSILPKLGCFDAIFFNGTFFEIQEKVIDYLFSNEVSETSNSANELLNTIEKVMSEVDEKYSTEQIDAFYDKIGQFNKHEMAPFFRKLMENGNITEKQYKDVIHKHSLTADVTENKSFIKTKKSNEMYMCLKGCLKDHMKKGSRFSSYLVDHSSKYSDSQFFDEMITNPDLNYSENMISITIDGQKRDALIMLIEMCC